MMVELEQNANNGVQLSLVSRLKTLPAVDLKKIEAIMSKAVATVYDPPEPGQPHVAVIVMGGSVIFAQAVGSVSEGEDLLQGIGQLAKQEGYI